MLRFKINLKPLSVNGAWKGRRFKTEKYQEFINNALQETNPSNSSIVTFLENLYDIICDTSVNKVIITMVGNNLLFNWSSKRFNLELTVNYLEDLRCKLCIRENLDCYFLKLADKYHKDWGFLKEQLNEYNKYSKIDNLHINKITEEQLDYVAELYKQEWRNIERTQESRRAFIDGANYILDLYKKNI